MATRRYTFPSSDNVDVIGSADGTRGCYLRESAVKRERNHGPVPAGCPERTDQVYLV